MFGKKPKIDVTVMKNRSNGIVFDKYNGAVKNIRKKNDEGQHVDFKYLVLARKGEKPIMIPAQHISFYQQIDGITSLNLYQYDSLTFYPLETRGKKLVAIVKIHELDESGNAKFDDYGNAIYTKEEKILLDPKVMIENGQYIEMPQLLTNKSYDKEQFFSSQYEFLTRFFRNSNWLEKFLPYLFMGLMLVGIVIVVIYDINKMTDQVHVLAKSNAEVAQAVAAATDNLRAIVQQKLSNITIPY
jgi:lipid-A-disaccharide synthase-like uncharacterized protein